ncbi:DUF4381 domain-containing protein [Rhizobium sp. RHZ01]|uniref:DUF4381 domain-containing protein n=1 Tax=Rhizobium sp. RHZ01 TaxID=2769304 RepID=UPI00177D3C78|nr:DUF4381 domain-containing protein [Rhizobium sp. RHZ01]MBD9446416.1 DUF4381 domain-containing protein [Rhizobium sp. RHZ01]
MDSEPKLDPITEMALRSLKDIAVPAPVSWMPQTWGWLIVVLLLLSAILLWCALAYRRWRKNAYRREALKHLEAIEVAVRDADKRARALRDLGELLKRTALAAWPRKDVAATSGLAWAAFLVEHRNMKNGEAFQRFFDDLEYQAATLVSTEVADGLVRDARRWIEGHHVPA